ncbi:hypothetical protein CHS0354_004676 [Potamilus streckersoni]|uniref:Essential protein Yae1 N-terminal domain-containing protein n=1 Tax=Potamilus streckersoni TaxID=2493646 RepID=A0AAE0SAY0_9BIVA|nr:hypothetical protein CHS0354_004676 [Potamilus streckersoni]
MCDDLFDADVPDELIEAKQWHKTESELTREGFRNGLSEGQEISLQDGFNQGFADAADILFPFAELRGQISAFLSFEFINNQDIGKEKESALQELVDEVSSYEASIIKSVSEIVSSTDNTSIQRACIDSDNPGGISVEEKSVSAPRKRDSSDGIPLEQDINFQRTNKLIVNKSSFADIQKKLQYFKEKLKTILS